jgi:hypothetical protein
VLVDYVRHDRRALLSWKVTQQAASRLAPRLPDVKGVHCFERECLERSPLEPRAPPVVDQPRAAMV